MLPYWDELKKKSNQQLRSQRGVLPVLIHPFFREYFRQNVLDIDEPKSIISVLDSVETSLKKRRKITDEMSKIETIGYYVRLRNLLKSNLSLISLGEYGPLVPSTIEFIRTMGFKGSILLYETENGDPIPNEDEGTWNTLAQAFLTLNFKTMAVVGQLIDENEKVKNKPHGCIPSFAHNMRTRFPKRKANNVIISPIVYPNWWYENEKHPFFSSNRKKR